MRIFLFQDGATNASPSEALPESLPAGSFAWIAIDRGELETRLPELQQALARLTGAQLFDLHVQDLLNVQLPSNYDYTSQYDVLVFRRLVTQALSARTALLQLAGDPAGKGTVDAPNGSMHANLDGKPPAAVAVAVHQRVETSPVGFVVFERVLLSVHPADCAVRDAIAARLSASAPARNAPASSEPRASAGRLPPSPADLMLRLVSLMVDGFLELRRGLTRQLDQWQAELLDPKSRAINWSTMLDMRLALQELDQVCEDQRAAVQDWIDTVETWPEAATANARRDAELLLVRSRDLLEHVERVVHHVRRLEQSAETAMQMHFSAQSNRTNDIMRVLTVLTAVFLPLNLIAGIFGMNFESIPLLHKADGFWIAMGAMLVIAAGLVIYFWRKRYLERTK